MLTLLYVFRVPAWRAPGLYPSGNYSSVTAALVPLHAAAGLPRKSLNKTLQPLALGRVEQL